MASCLEGFRSQTQPAGFLQTICHVVLLLQLLFAFLSRLCSAFQGRAADKRWKRTGLNGRPLNMEAGPESNRVGGFAGNYTYRIFSTGYE